MTRYEKRGSSEQFSLLAKIDRLRGRGEAARFPVPDFDEYEAGPIAHDKVDLPEPAPEVPGDEAQPAAPQMFESQRFRLPP